MQLVFIFIHYFVSLLFFRSSYAFQVVTIAVVVLASFFGNVVLFSLSWTERINNLLNVSHVTEGKEKKKNCKNFPFHSTVCMVRENDAVGRWSYEENIQTYVI